MPTLTPGASGGLCISGDFWQSGSLCATIPPATSVLFFAESLVPAGHRPGLPAGGAGGVGELAQRGRGQLLLRCGLPSESFPGQGARNGRWRRLPRAAAAGRPGA